MANAFQRGDLAGVQFQPASGSLQTLNVTGWTLDDTSDLYDVTHTGLNGAGTARIAGKGDSSGTVNADYDGDLPPYLNPPQILKGTRGVILCFVAPGKPIQIPIIIEKVHYEAAVGSQVKYSFEWKENVLAGSRVYPSA